METYTVIKKGETIQHCLKIPPEFLNKELEITIKPVRKYGDYLKKFELLFERNRNINPFDSISDPAQWQRGIRSDW
jgi:hypothetical protein